MFDAFFNTIFGPFLKLGPLPTVIVLSLIVSLLMVFIYKWMTDQTKMKDLKTEIKKNQKQMKEFRKDPAKLMEVQKKVTKMNMTYMKESFKPTLITFIPIIIIFGWMNAHLYFEPITPGQEFNVDVMVDENLEGNVSVETAEGLDIVKNTSSVPVKNNQALFAFKADDPGEYWITFDFLDSSVQKKVIITKELNYAPPLEKFDEQIQAVSIQQNKLKVLFGLTWLWTYIIFAVIFSMVLRKMLKVY